MCGRFDVDVSNREIDELLSRLPEGRSSVKTGEVFPGSQALVLSLQNGMPAPEAMAWGFPRRDGKGIVFNARAESAMQKPMFRKALKEHPAAVPATGFYEWHPNPLLERKDKFRFTQPEDGLLWLAGFWNEFPSEEVARHFTLLTTGANASMLPYHHRMPVLLGQEEVEKWLLGENRASVLTREPAAVTATLV